MIATAIQSDYQLPSAALQPTQVVAIGSGEGGVGKINLVINLAFALARRGEDVVILDGDLGLGNVQIALGLPFGKDLSEFLLGECTQDEISIQGPRGIRVVAGGRGRTELSCLGDVDVATMVRGFAELRRAPSVMLLDSQPGLAPAFWD